MDLADASVVVVSERHPRAQVFTVDRTDFSIYQRTDRQVIDLYRSAEIVKNNSGRDAPPERVKQR